MLQHDRGTKGMISLALLITTFITNIVIIKSKDEKRQCNQTVFVDPGSTEEWSFSVSDFHMVNSRLECSRLFIPNQLDTHFTVEAPRLYHATVNVTGYDPQGFDPVPLMSSRQLFKDRSNKAAEKFNHMAIKVKVTAGWRYHHQISVRLHITLRKNELRELMTVRAENNYNYIVSPNYPASYGNERDFYEWHIVSSRPFMVELRDMDVGIFHSKSCPTDRLYIGIGSQIYESVTWPLCGKLENYVLLTDEVPIWTTLSKTVAVKLVIDRNAPARNHTGFLIRYRHLKLGELLPHHLSVGYKLKEKKSNPTGVAVGSTIATLVVAMLCVAAAAVVIVRFRQVQHERQQRRRRQRRREAREQRGETEGSAVFMLGSVVINTSAPPPPYPGPPAPQNGANNNNNNNDEGRVGGNSDVGNCDEQTSPGTRQCQAQHTRGRRDISNHNGGENPEDMEDPPPYHPLMSRGDATNQRTDQLSDEPPAYENSSSLHPPPTYGEAINS